MKIVQHCFSTLTDCRINGRLISLGEPVIGVAQSSCETCFCINGQVRCDKVICPPIRAQISPNCGPVYSEGHCCPTSYNCTTNNGTSLRRIHNNIIYYSVFIHTGSLTSLIQTHIIIIIISSVFRIEIQSVPRDHS